MIVAYSGAPGALGDDAVTNLIRSMVRDIRVETVYGPTIDIPDPFEPAPPNPFMEAMKPTITLNPGAPGRVSVGASDAEIGAYAVSRLKNKGAGMPKSTLDAVKRCAVKFHHENRALYRRVMR